MSKLYQWIYNNNNEIATFLHNNKAGAVEHNNMTIYSIGYNFSSSSLSYPIVFSMTTDNEIVHDINTITAHKDDCVQLQMQFSHKDSEKPIYDTSCSSIEAISFIGEYMNSVNTAINDLNLELQTLVPTAGKCGCKINFKLKNDFSIVDIDRSLTIVKFILIQNAIQRGFKVYDINIIWGEDIC